MTRLDLKPEDKNYNLRPQISKGCKSKDNCDKIFKSELWTKRMMKVAVLSGMNMGVTKDFEKLCSFCQQAFYEFYKSEIRTDAEDRQIFQLMVRESNAAEAYHECYQHLSKLLDGKNYDQSEIDDYIKYYQRCKIKYNSAHKLLEEKLNENEARKRGYKIE
jgi:hypothetical protein